MDRSISHLRSDLLVIAGIEQQVIQLGADEALNLFSGLVRHKGSPYSVKMLLLFLGAVQVGGAMVRRRGTDD